MRETCSREDRELLATDKGIGTIDGRYTGLDKIRRHTPGVRVNCSTGDIEAFLRHNLRTAIDRFTTTGQDTAEHFTTHGHLDGFASETDTAVPADTGRILEDLDHYQFVARVENLTTLG